MKVKLPLHTEKRFIIKEDAKLLQARKGIVHVCHWFSRSLLDICYPRQNEVPKQLFWWLREFNSACSAFIRFGETS